MQEQTIAPDVRELIEKARRGSATADSEEALSTEVVDLLRASGAADVFAPYRDDNRPTFRGLTSTLVELGEACASTSWLASVYSYNGRICRYFSAEGQAVIWNGEDRPLISSGLMPMGSLRHTDGGVVVGGTWRYVSGLTHADWVVLTARGDEEPEPRNWLVAMPVNDVTHEKTWNALGLRATNSDSARVDDIFVPNHLVTPHNYLVAGTTPVDGKHAWNLPLPAVGALTFAAPALGATSALLTALVDNAIARNGASTPPPHVLAPLAEAAASVRTARATLLSVADRLDVGRDSLVVADTAHDCAFAAELCRRALVPLGALMGTGFLAHPNGIQRHWRDAQISLTHAALGIEKPNVALWRAITTPQKRQEQQR